MKQRPESDFFPYWGVWECGGGPGCALGGIPGWFPDCNNQDHKN